MRGAFFVNADAKVSKKDRTIDFFVLDPNYQVIYSKRGQEEGIFRFNTTMQGQYTFVFSNMKDKVNIKKVTIAIHPGRESEDGVDEEIAQMTKAEKTDYEQMRHEMAEAAGVPEEDIEELQSALRQVLKNVKNLQTEAKMSMIRQNAHSKAVDSNEKSTLYMTLFEALAFMGICSFNLYHIKGILENRRII